MKKLHKYRISFYGKTTNIKLLAIIEGETANDAIKIAQKTFGSKYTNFRSTKKLS